MGKFKFRLSSLLSIKEKMEQLKKNEYAEALLILNNLVFEKENLISEMQNNIENMQLDLNSNLKPVQIIRYTNYIKIIKLRIKDIEVKITDARAVSDQKRDSLIDAMKERKMLENLKEKDYKEFNIEENKEEQKFLDEITSYKVSDKIGGDDYGNAN